MNQLLERTALMEALLAAHDRTAAGHGSTVLVEGEAGIGKTSLLQEFAARAV
jgi:predicted ATPase